MKRFTLLLVTCILCMLFSTVNAQKESHFPDTVEPRKNVIKWNMTPFLLWSYKNINLGYERVVKPYQSISVNAGYFELPRLFGGVRDSININNASQKAGISFAADYRFYFKKRNKKFAPDGLYWGPYLSYYYYTFDNNIQIFESPVISGDLSFGGTYNILNAGVQIGYQFVFWKDRMTVDLVFMGPSISMYVHKFRLSGNLDADEENEYLQAIYDIMANRIPGFEQLVNEGDVTTSGVNTSLGYGMRYMIQIGFNF